MMDELHNPSGDGERVIEKGGTSRRQFLSQVSFAGAGLTLAPLIAGAGVTETIEAPAAPVEPGFEGYSIRCAP